MTCLMEYIKGEDWALVISGVNIVIYGLCCGFLGYMIYGLCCGSVGYVRYGLCYGDHVYVMIYIL